MADEPSPFAACTRFLSGHGPRRAAAQLQSALEQVDRETRSDFYGSGEIIESFEEDLAALLGHEAAVFMPSGTMAQQIALRVWSDDANCKRIAMHATSHLQVHEQNAYRELHGLDAQLLGDTDRLFDLDDLKALQEPLSTILWELPQREIGGQLPTWDALLAEIDWTKAQGIRRHLDGARLWEAAPHFGKSHAEIAGLFDSVYVSFYKGIGGIAGAILAGPSDFIAKSRVWLRRHGGNLISLHPYILSARAGMQQHIGKFAGYRKRAQEIAARLGDIDGIRVVPPVPPTLMMHLHVDADADALNAANHELAAESRVMLFGNASPRPDGKSKIELSIASACQSLENDEIERLFRRLLSQV
jgi:threonine aldolase